MGEEGRCLYCGAELKVDNYSAHNDTPCSWVFCPNCHAHTCASVYSVTPETFKQEPKTGFFYIAELANRVWGDCTDESLFWETPYQRKSKEEREAIREEARNKDPLMKAYTAFMERPAPDDPLVFVEISGFDIRVRRGDRRVWANYHMDRLRRAEDIEEARGEVRILRDIMGMGRFAWDGRDPDHGFLLQTAGTRLLPMSNGGCIMDFVLRQEDRLTPSEKRRRYTEVDTSANRFKIEDIC